MVLWPARVLMGRVVSIEGNKLDENLVECWNGALRTNGVGEPKGVS